MMHAGPKYVLTYLCVSILVSVLSVKSFAKDEVATILLSLQPQKSSGKPWDWGKGADPIICLKQGCYIGRGFIASAKFYEGKKAFYPLTHARACKNSLTCIFRKVVISEQQSTIRPVDLDGLNAEKMQLRSLKIDHSCHIEHNRLNCLNGIYTSEYSIWVVPESIAEQAGKQLLDYALFRGLYEARQSNKVEFIREQRQSFPEVANRFFSVITGEAIPGSCEYNSEALGEIFYISGAFQSSRREHFSPLINLLTAESEFEAVKKIKNLEHKNFWGLQDAIELIKQYAYADRHRLVRQQKGIKLLRAKHKTTLLYGWDVKSRANKIISGCTPSHHAVKVE